MSLEPDELLRQLAELGSEFKKSFPAKRQALEQAYSDCQNNPGRASLETLLLLAHSLKGSSGSHGLEQLSKASFELETAAKAAMEKSDYAVQSLSLPLKKVLKVLSDI